MTVLPINETDDDKIRPLRGVTVGAGYFSQFHYDAWSRIDGVEIVGVCDTDIDRANLVAQKHSIPNIYRDVQAMLEAEKPDFVDIITRPESHLELVRIAAAAGVDVICQKPLAPTTSEARLLVSVANDAGVRLMVHENFRFQPWYREISMLLKSSVIGNTLQTVSVRTRTGDGWQPDAYQARQPYFVTMPQLLIFETGVHFIDTFRFLAGEIDGVYASLRQLNPNIAGEDAGIVMFEFASGAQGIWDASRYHESNCADPRYTFGQCLIEADGGSIRLAFDGTLSIQPHGQPEMIHTYEHAPANFASDCVLHTQQHFADSLRTGASFETSGDEYLKTLAIQDAIYKSAEDRLPVRGLSDCHSDATSATKYGR